MKSMIPIHTFEQDKWTLVPVRYVALGITSGYDFSVAHRHNYFELFFFTRGGGSHLVDFNEFAVEDQSIQVVCPGQVHLLKRAPDSFGAVIHFSTSLFEGRKQALLNSPFLNNPAAPAVKLTGEEYGVMEVLLRQLQNEAAKDPFSAEIMTSYAELLIMKYLQAMESRHPEHPELKPTAFNDFRALAEQSFSQNRAASHYAEKLSMTEKQLNKLCLNSTGASVSDYLKQRLLLEAKRLLYNSGESIKEVAHALGFEDPSYFNRFFRKNTGLTPGEFRSQK